MKITFVLVVLVVFAGLVFFIPEIPALLDTWIHHTADTVQTTVAAKAPALLHMPSSPADQAEANTGIHKCIDAQGTATFSNKPCDAGQISKDVRLSRTTVLHMGEGDSHQDSDSTPGSTSNSTGDGTSHGNTQTALHQKFGAQ